MSRPGAAYISSESPAAFLELKLRPLGVRPGGGFQCEDGKSVHQVNGKEAQKLLAQRASWWAWVAAIRAAPRVLMGKRVP